MLYKIVVLMIITALGWISGLFDANIIIKMNSAGAQMTGQDLETISLNIMIAWAIGIVTGIGSLFIESKWRYPLLLGPIIFPALYVVFYAITH